MSRVPTGLQGRRRLILARIEGRHRQWHTHADRLAGTVHAWAGSPRSLLHAFLAGLVTDQLLATLRYRMMLTNALRPAARLLPLLTQALSQSRRFFP